MNLIIPALLALYPAAQAVHDEAAIAPLYFPLSHFVQFCTDLWKLAKFPLSLRYLPAEQAVHALDPSPGAYSPSPQIEHEEAPAKLYVPTAHALHSVPSR